MAKGYSRIIHEFLKGTAGYKRVAAPRLCFDFIVGFPALTRRAQ
jgi:hypothetical protein